MAHSSVLVQIGSAIDVNGYTRLESRGALDALGDVHGRAAGSGQTRQLRVSLHEPAERFGAGADQREALANVLFPVGRSRFAAA